MPKPTNKDDKPTNKDDTVIDAGSSEKIKDKKPKKPMKKLKHMEETEIEAEGTITAGTMVATFDTGRVRLARLRDTK